MDSIICIIPARGGSKGLPGKNIKMLNGKPLIGWTIEAAQDSKYIEKIVVSSDDDKILDVSRQYGIDVMRRSKKLATDSAGTVDVVREVLDSQDENYEFVLLLQCTSPLRKAKHIDEAIEMLLASKDKADAIMSVKENEHPIQWIRKISKEGYLRDFFDNKFQENRRQSYDKTYLPNGAIYLIKKLKFLEDNTFQPERTIPYIMDNAASIDIDTAEDFKLVEYFASRMSEL